MGCVVSVFSFVWVSKEVIPRGGEVSIQGMDSEPGVLRLTTLK